MSKLPVLSWKDVVKAVSKKGFKVVRQRGSHQILEGTGGRFTVVPRYQTMVTSTLMKIARALT